jgi:hypothetical protein
MIVIITKKHLTTFCLFRDCCITTLQNTKGNKWWKQLVLITVKVATKVNRWILSLYFGIFLPYEHFSCDFIVCGNIFILLSLRNVDIWFLLALMFVFIVDFFFSFVFSFRCDIFDIFFLNMLTYF